MNGPGLGRLDLADPEQQQQRLAQPLVHDHPAVGVDLGHARLAVVEQLDGGEHLLASDHVGLTELVAARPQLLDLRLQLVRRADALGDDCGAH